MQDRLTTKRSGGQGRTGVFIIQRCGRLARRVEGCNWTPDRHLLTRKITALSFLCHLQLPLSSLHNILIFWLHFCCIKLPKGVFLLQNSNELPKYPISRGMCTSQLRTQNYDSKKFTKIRKGYLSSNRNSLRERNLYGFPLSLRRIKHDKPSCLSMFLSTTEHQTNTLVEVDLHLDIPHIFPRYIHRHWYNKIAPSWPFGTFPKNHLI